MAGLVMVNVLIAQQSASYVAALLKFKALAKMSRAKLVGPTANLRFAFYVAY